MRIAIVNELPGAVESLRQALCHAKSGNAPHQVVWVACDGAEAVRRCVEDRPDLLLLGLSLPGMDGVETTRHIMSQSPCAILLVSHHDGTHTGKIFDAMGAGALDVVAPPPGAATPPTEFLAKLDTMARFVGHGTRKTKSAARPAPGARPARAANRLVAIGSSAGGRPRWRDYSAGSRLISPPP